ncbi:hypothetical protein LQ327_17825 [Actinomycetospora endophytica]|uniref:Uncharacterized protein n=1 Tax=Actinomycetospora endophytica TaxID=2291215 RepID=A0ABS8PCL0_9PSEU|nr:hypothetical protein [Actinomycetospora endophytica]MCD2195230.1 hypothetical protein [Actinomycetospora endophytica]
MGTTYRYRVLHPDHPNHNKRIDMGYRLREARPPSPTTVDIDGVTYREADVPGGDLLVPAES